MKNNLRNLWSNNPHFQDKKFKSKKQNFETSPVQYQFQAHCLAMIFTSQNVSSFFRGSWLENIETSLKLKSIEINGDINGEFL